MRSCGFSGWSGSQLSFPLYLRLWQSSQFLGVKNGPGTTEGLAAVNWHIDIFICRRLCDRTTTGERKEWGFSLTPVATICCGWGHEGGLPPKPRRVGSSILDRGGVPGVPAEAALAGGVRVPALWDPVLMGQQTQSAALRRLRLPGLGDGGHDFPGHPQALDVVVPGGLVGDNAKRRGQRAGVAAGLGFG